MIKQIIFLSLGWLMAVGVISQPVQAAKQGLPTTTKATFQIRPELPADNLGGPHLGYYNLPLKANQARTVRLQLFNPTAQPLTITGQVQDATTLTNATVDYLGHQPINRQLLPQPGSQLVSVPATTKLQPNETKWLTIQIAAVQSLFNGQKAVAINLSAVQPNPKKTIQNHYVYAVGLVLNGQPLTTKQYRAPRSPRIKTKLKAQRAAIAVAIVNPNPAYLKPATIDVQLQNKRWQLVHYQRRLTQRKVAPNSQFDVELLLGGKRLVPGIYRMTLRVKSPQLTRKIVKTVRITKRQATYINQRNADYQRHRLLIGLAGISVSSLSGFMSYRYYKRKRG